MIRKLSSRRQLLLVGPVLAALMLLSGCQGHKTVAHVGTAVITEEEYFDRVQHVTQLNKGMDAGKTAMMSIVWENIIVQYAEEKKYTPSNDDVQKVVAYQLKRDPQLAEAIKQDPSAIEELTRSVRLQMIQLAIGVDGARVEDKDLVATYEKVKDKLKLPDMYTIRIMRLPNAPLANQALALMKKSGNFQQALQELLRVPAEKVAPISKENRLSAAQIPPEIVAAIDHLPENAFVEKPVEVTPDPTQADPRPSKSYFVVQLIKKEPAPDLKQDEIRPFLAQLYLSQTHPGADAHKDQALLEYAKNLVSKNLLQINIKRYESLIKDTLLPMLEQAAAQSSYTSGGGMPAGALGGPAGNPAGAPGSSPGTAPGSGSGTGPAPRTNPQGKIGTPPPTGAAPGK